MDDNNLIDPDTLTWIHQIQAQTSALLLAVEEMDNDINCSSPFDAEDARACFKEVEEIVLELRNLLDVESEPEPPETEDD